MSKREKHKQWVVVTLVQQQELITFPKPINSSQVKAMYLDEEFIDQQIINREETDTLICVSPIVGESSGIFAEEA